MLYSINKENPAATRLAQMEWELLEAVADLHTKKLKQRLVRDR
jgi:hypothetical protein